MNLRVEIQELLSDANQVKYHYKSAIERRALKLLREAYGVLDDERGTRQ